MKKILCILTIIVFSGCDHTTSPEDNPSNNTTTDDTAVSSIQKNPESISEEEYPEHSIGELLDLAVPGSDFTIGKILDENEFYKRHYITYVSDGLTISGIMNVPKPTRSDPGPWPVLFLNHGYIDPVIYTNGRGLKREQDYLARRGYVVIHSDYRGHAQSDANPVTDDKVGESGYTRDILGGINAFKSLNPDFAHVNKIGMLGHSMGGGVTMRAAVARPEQIQAVVLYAPVSSDYLDNLQRWMLDRISPDEASKVQDGEGNWDEQLLAPFSPMTYFDRIETPFMIHHGDGDKDVPLQWSKDTRNRLESEGKEVIYHEYPREGHEFGMQWEKFMQRSVIFFDEYLKK